jgi:hypothetical protein
MMKKTIFFALLFICVGQLAMAQKIPFAIKGSIYGGYIVPMTKNIINTTSALENAETSSIGRALACLSLGGSEYASANEVENAISQQEQIKHNQNTSNQQTYQPQRQKQNQYQHQNDFTTLLNAGLQIIDNGDTLTVSGDGIFEKKSIIKNAGFRWNGQNRVWFMQKREAA